MSERGYTCLDGRQEQSGSVLRGEGVAQPCKEQHAFIVGTDSCSNYLQNTRNASGVPFAAHLKDLDEGSHAVGCARGVGYDGILVLVITIVDTHDEGRDAPLAGGSDDHLLGTSSEVLACAGLVHEDTRALDHKVHAHLAPGQLCGVAVGDNADRLAVHGDGAVAVNLQSSWMFRSREPLQLDASRRVARWHTCK